jgi:redox-sensitive bicupin YhaK (pirin superfamily)
METQKLKSVLTIIKSQKVNMGGSILDQPLPTRELKSLDPFVLIHHFKGQGKPGRSQGEGGIGPHPHRGFFPVTFIYKGENEHRDSMGNNQVLRDGGTQWLFSGSGILHSERPSKAFTENGGESEGIQLWINSPAKYKMTDPFYTWLSAEDTPVRRNNNSEISVVSGDFEGITGPAKTQSPMTILRGTLGEQGEVQFNLPTQYNTLIYLLDGEILVNGVIAKAKNMVIFKNDGDSVVLKASKDTRYIVLSGEPIGEPIVAQGPFVMNTEQEIMEAYQDTRNGKMGELVEF